MKTEPNKQPEAIPAPAETPSIQELAAGAHYPQVTGWTNPAPNAEPPLNPSPSLTVQLGARPNVQPKGTAVAWRWRFGPTEAGYELDPKWRLSEVPMAGYMDREIQPLYAHPAPQAPAPGAGGVPDPMTLLGDDDILNAAQGWREFDAPDALVDDPIGRKIYGACRAVLNEYRDRLAATQALAVGAGPAVLPKRCEHVRHLHVGNNKNFCKACGLWVWSSDGIDVGEPGADDRAHAQWCRNNLGAWGCGREARGEKRCEQWCGSTTCPSSLKDGRPAGDAFRTNAPESKPPVQGSGQ